MEVKIGIQSVLRELILETNDEPEDIERALSAAVTEGTLLVLYDDKGGKVMVPADKIAYVEVGTGPGRRVGFGA
ncbi:MAG: DUF3107 domain-containing protein [Actinomycetota bacterium]|nr:DUF3107 domain-containing protein [Actinomycetota bacterium]